MQLLGVDMNIKNIYIEHYVKVQIYTKSCNVIFWAHHFNNYKYKLKFAF